MFTINQRLNTAYKSLKDQFNYTNQFQSPRIEKVVVSTGVGRIQDKKQRELIADRLMKISGQKPASRGAKKSIAAFKVREGDEVGFQATLRGKRALGFLEKLINIALPRTRDFRGISRSAVDVMGNCTIGIREHIIFPETSDEELRDVFGLAVTIVTTAKDREETLEFLVHLGLPFAKA